MYRADLQTKAAQQIMRKYQGKQLFPFEKEGESLTEYLLTMQIHKEKKQYASFMVQISPFLYELFMTYAKMNLKMPLFDYREKVAGRRLLRRQTLLQKPQGPELIAYLDNVWPQPFMTANCPLFCSIKSSALPNNSTGPKMRKNIMNLWQIR